jgi:hypothetical protein
LIEQRGFSGAGERDREAHLSPGMSAQVEIITGRRSVISYLRRQLRARWAKPAESVNRRSPRFRSANEPFALCASLSIVQLRLNPIA